MLNSLNNIPISFPLHPLATPFYFLCLWILPLWVSHISCTQNIQYLSICELLISLKIASLKGFPGSSGGKESTCNAGDPDSIPGSGRSPGGGDGNPLQYSFLENPCGQRSMVGYSPWVCKVRYDWATKQHSSKALRLTHATTCDRIFFLVTTG